MLLSKRTVYVEVTVSIGSDRNGIACTGRNNVSIGEDMGLNTLIILVVKSASIALAFYEVVAKCIKSLGKNIVAVSVLLVLAAYRALGAAHRAGLGTGGLNSGNCLVLVSAKLAVCHATNGTNRLSLTGSLATLVTAGDNLGLDEDSLANLTLLTLGRAILLTGSLYCGNNNVLMGAKLAVCLATNGTDLLALASSSAALVAVGSDFLNVCIATNSTGKGSLTLLGTGLLLSNYRSTEGVFCSLGLVVRICCAANSTYALSVGMLLTGSLVVGVSLATYLALTVDVLVVVGLIHSGNEILNVLAGCKSKYHYDYENNTRQKT